MNVEALLPFILAAAAGWLANNYLRKTSPKISNNPLFGPSVAPAAVVAPAPQMVLQFQGVNPPTMVDPNAPAPIAPAAPTPGSHFQASVPQAGLVSFQPH